MPISVTFKLEGVDRLIRTARRYRKTRRERVERTIAKYAILIEREAKANVPVDTSDLRSTIRKILDRLTSDLVAEVRAGGIDGAATGQLVTYAVFVELGTALASAQAFLFPAFEHHAPAFYRDLQQAMRRP